MSDSDRNDITYTWLAFSVLALLAAGYLILGELRNAEPTVADEYDTSRYADRAQDRIDRICVGLAGVELLHCEYEVEQPERENYRAQKDLRAQWYMAIWAGFMTLFTFGTLVVTGLGVHFVRQTLHQTAATNNAALKAAEAANKSNDIMLQEQRPFLSPGEVWIEPQRDIKSTSVNRNNFTFHMKWRNTGKTPAKPLTVRAYVVFTGNLANMDSLTQDLVENERYEISARKGVLFNDIAEQVWTMITGADFDWPVDSNERPSLGMQDVRGGARDHFARPTQPCVVMFEIDYVSAFSDLVSDQRYWTRACFVVEPQFDDMSGDFIELSVSPLHGIWDAK